MQPYEPVGVAVLITLGFVASSLDIWGIPYIVKKYEESKGIGVEKIPDDSILKIPSSLENKRMMKKLHE